MAIYTVPVTCASPEKAEAASDALFDAGIARRWASQLGYGEDFESQPGARQLTAELEAKDAAAAESQVQEAVGDDCEVGPAKPLGD